MTGEVELQTALPFIAVHLFDTAIGWKVTGIANDYIEATKMAYRIVYGHPQ